MKKKQQKQTIRKRSFLLFELLISLALIALCLFPLLKPHIEMKSRETSMLKKMYFEREAATAFCWLKVKLFQHEIPWEKLFKNEEGIIGEIAMENGAFSYKRQPYQCRYSLRFLGERHKKTQEILAAFEAKIFFYREKEEIEPFTFFLDIEKKAV